MGLAKRTKKFAQAKRIIGKRDERLREKATRSKAQHHRHDHDDTSSTLIHVPQVPSNLFFAANTAPGPPYQIIMDTNFISHSLSAKLDILEGCMDLLYAKCVPVISDCVVAELEKLGSRYRLALQASKDPRFTRLKCGHTKPYADDCIVDTVLRHRIYLVGTNDKLLRRRLRKIPGVPLMGVTKGRYNVERLPDLIR